MKLTKIERYFLVTLMTVAQKMLASSLPASSRNGIKPRKRRSGADVTRFRREVETLLKARVPVKDIAHKLGVTPAYIYQLKRR